MYLYIRKFYTTRACMARRRYVWSAVWRCVCLFVQFANFYITYLVCVFRLFASQNPFHDSVVQSYTMGVLGQLTPSHKINIVAAPLRLAMCHRTFHVGQIPFTNYLFINYCIVMIVKCNFRVHHIRDSGMGMGAGRLAKFLEK